MEKSRINILLSDIRFWILVAFLLRLYGITFSPLEVNHNWRQSTVNMVARNFFEISNNIFLPRIDFAGDLTGITGMEFPFFNYLIYLSSLIFGFDHWYGRLINLMISSLGIWYFYKLIKQLWNTKLAFSASFILLFSHWFKYSRKIMPDTFAVSLVMIGLYFAFCYLQRKNQNILYLIGATLLMPIGALAKLPAGYAYAFFIIPLINKQFEWKKKVYLFGGLTLGLLSVLFWYFYWSPYLTTHYQFYHFFQGKSLQSGFFDILYEPKLFLKNFYEYPLHFVGFGLFALGIFSAIRADQKDVLTILSLGMVAYIPVILKGGWTFIHHSYYMVPVTPLMALIAGIGLNSIPNRYIFTLFCCAYLVDNGLSQMDDFKVRENYFSFENLEEDLNSLGVSATDLIVINSHPNPTPFYFSNRKGWLLSNDQIVNSQTLFEITKGKAKYLVVTKECFGSNISTTTKPIYSRDTYDIYNLSEFYPPKK